MGTTGIWSSTRHKPRKAILLYLLELVLSEIEAKDARYPQEVPCIFSSLHGNFLALVFVMFYKYRFVQ